MGFAAGGIPGNKSINILLARETESVSEAGRVTSIL